MSRCGHFSVRYEVRGLAQSRVPVVYRSVLVCSHHLDFVGGIAPTILALKRCTQAKMRSFLRKRRNSTCGVRAKQDYGTVLGELRHVVQMATTDATLPTRGSALAGDHHDSYDHWAHPRCTFPPFLGLVLPPVMQHSYVGTSTTPSVGVEPTPKVYISPLSRSCTAPIHPS